jgi:hypothetical protein
MAGVAKTVNGVSKGFGDAGSAMTKLFTVPLLAIGAIALASAVDIDKANDIIRVTTGKTGDDLEKLKGSFKNVFKEVPNDVESVGRAIGELHTRTGLVGEPLENMATQLLNLSTITKTDVNTLIPLTTRLFGDWSVATEDQSKTLDMLYKTSQQTGIGVASLSQTVVQFGAPLRQLGFTLSESTAMLGKWEKEGVNVETVLVGMKFGLKTFAREGIDAREGMIKYTQSIKDAATPAEATGIAMKIFGMRAGPDMAAAIREGRFETDDLIKSIAASPDTINKAAWATFDFGEKFAILKHKVEAALEPLGKKLMDALDKLVPTFEKAAKGLGDLTQSFSDLPISSQKTILEIVAVIAVIGPLLTIISKVVGALGSLFTALGWIATGIKAVASSIYWFLGPIGLFVTALIIAEFAIVKFTLRSDNLLVKIRGWVDPLYWAYILLGKVKEQLIILGIIQDSTAKSTNAGTNALNNYNFALGSLSMGMTPAEAALNNLRTATDQKRMADEAVTVAQDAYNQAVLTYGPLSQQAKDAHNNLTSATQNAADKTNNLTSAQYNMQSAAQNSIINIQNLIAAMNAIPDKKTITIDYIQRTFGLAPGDWGYGGEQLQTGGWVTRPSIAALAEDNKPEFVLSNPMLQDLRRGILPSELSGFMTSSASPSMNLGMASAGGQHSSGTTVRGGDTNIYVYNPTFLDGSPSQARSIWRKLKKVADEEALR